MNGERETTQELVAGTGRDSPPRPVWGGPERGDHPESYVRNTSTKKFMYAPQEPSHTLTRNEYYQREEERTMRFLLGAVRRGGQNGHKEPTSCE